MNLKEEDQEKKLSNIHELSVISNKNFLESLD
jgi:hypothetical protein